MPQRSGDSTPGAFFSTVGKIRRRYGRERFQATVGGLQKGFRDISMTRSRNTLNVIGESGSNLKNQVKEISCTLSVVAAALGDDQTAGIAEAGLGLLSFRPEGKAFDAVAGSQHDQGTASQRRST